MLQPLDKRGFAFMKIQFDKDIYINKYGYFGKDKIIVIYRKGFNKQGKHIYTQKYITSHSFNNYTNSNHLIGYFIRLVEELQLVKKKTIYISNLNKSIIANICNVSIATGARILRDLKADNLLYKHNNKKWEFNPFLIPNFNIYNYYNNLKYPFEIEYHKNFTIEI